jgi:hypothetical protein
MPQSSAAITAFWTWFAQNADVLAKHLDSSDSVRLLTELLSPRVASLDARLRWEVGPGLRAKYGFTLSPAGRRDVLPLTDAIVAAAPHIDDWEFLSGKPPKRWDLRFRVAGATVDARSWQYLLVGYNDGEFYDVTLVAKNLPTSLYGQRETVGYVLVEGLLGERVVIEKIGKVDVVDRAPPDSADRLSQIGDLAGHLIYLESHGAAQ